MYEWQWKEINLSCLLFLYQLYILNVSHSCLNLNVHVVQVKLFMIYIPIITVAELPKFKGSTIETK